MSDIQLKDQYYLTRTQYNAKKAAHELVVGGQYYITDENYQLVTSISSESTDTQYPSAKCVYDIIGDVESLLAAI